MLLTFSIELLFKFKFPCNDKLSKSIPPLILNEPDITADPLKGNPFVALLVVSAKIAWLAVPIKLLVTTCSLSITPLLNDVVLP